MKKGSRFSKRCAFPLCPKMTRMETVRTMKLNPLMNRM